MRKKYLSLLLVFCLVLGMLPVSAFAADAAALGTVSVTAWGAPKVTGKAADGNTVKYYVGNSGVTLTAGQAVPNGLTEIEGVLKADEEGKKTLYAVELGTDSKIVTSGSLDLTKKNDTYTVKFDTLVVTIDNKTVSAKAAKVSNTNSAYQLKGDAVFYVAAADPTSTIGSWTKGSAPSTTGWTKLTGTTLAADAKGYVVAVNSATDLQAVGVAEIPAGSDTPTPVEPEKTALTESKVTLANAEVTLDEKGEAALPDVTVDVKDAVKDTDYTVTWTGPDGKEVTNTTVKTAGEYTVTVAAKADSKLLSGGSVKLTCTVKAAPQEVTATTDKDSTPEAVKATVEKVENVEADKPVEITVNPSGASADKTQSTAVTIPTETVKALEKAPSTTITTPIAKIEIPAETMKQIAQKLGTSESTTLEVKKNNEAVKLPDTVKPADVAIEATDVSFKTAGGGEVEMKGTLMDILLPLAKRVEAKLTGTNPMVYYIKDGAQPKDYKDMKAVLHPVNNTKFLKFSTSHLSTFAQITEQDAKTIGAPVVVPADKIEAEYSPLDGLTKLTINVDAKYNDKWAYFQTSGKGVKTGAAVQIKGGKATTTTSIQSGTYLVIIFEAEDIFNEDGTLKAEWLAVNSTGNGVEFKTETK